MGVQESSIPTPSFCREIRGKELGLWPGASSSDLGLHLSKAASNPVQGQESLLVEGLWLPPWSPLLLDLNPLAGSSSSTAFFLSCNCCSSLYLLVSQRSGKADIIYLLPLLPCSAFTPLSSCFQSSLNLLQSLDNSLWFGIPKCPHH